MFGGDRPKAGKIKKYSSINIVFIVMFHVCTLHTRSKVKSGYGPIRIKRGLLEKGVEKKMALGSLKELEIDWFECAKKTYDKKFDSEIRDVKDYARRVRFLVYKGFETVHVKAVMGEWDNQ